MIILAASGLASPGLPTVTEVHIYQSLSEIAPGASGSFLLVFFSTDCPSCYDELFEARLVIETAGWPVTVVGICSGPLDELKTFLAKYGWTLPVVHDRRKLLFRRFHVETVPYKAVIISGETVCRDDPYVGYPRRWEELRTCLKKRFSR